MKYGARNNTKNNRVVGNIRKSQLITTFGSGSIVDMSDYSVIMAATDYWHEGEKLFEPNLQRLLGVKYFQQPITTDDDLQMGNPDIPAFRFPMMHFCPQCKRLMSYRDFGDLYIKKCMECNKGLVPSRFVAACENGHLEDFPYRWWVHNGDFSSCPAADVYDKLKIEFTNTSGGLGSITIKCTACGKERTMEGSMGNNALKGYSCRGQRPWIGMRKEHYDPEKCTKDMRTLQRGASNVYFSLVQSALTIPPWSNSIHTEIEKKWDSVVDFMKNEPEDSIKRMFVQALFVDIIEKGVYRVEDFLDGINKRMNTSSNDEEKFNELKLFEQEYKALSVSYEGELEEKFKSSRSSVPECFEEYFSDVMLIKRLREVCALKGYRRITPEKSYDEADCDKVKIRDYAPLSSQKLEWLPAVEMTGEGIFIRFNENRIKEWESIIGKRYERMGSNLKMGNMIRDNFSPRYVLLHTFAHLLIRQITIQCGYSSSALKERIYSTYKDSEFNMAGVLIYTSSSDSDGSLGGVVRQGEADVLNNTVLNLLQEASWCSSDPLCIESTDQGYNSLNYAACHACALLPETSCESRNSLLDRVALTGKMEDRSLGYFGGILDIL